ncbi:MAG: hypothetical protein LQ339_008836 [Xanthoria mediterranea]|nr:MAG: hypothetical protein LQ339_008836 [Xanthoria mediterranea]
MQAQTQEERDTLVLAKLGKKSVLKRRFDFLSILGFACTILVTWEGSLILFTTGLTNGGSAGLVFGYLFVWIGTIAVFTTMAEMASMAPTSGGQYHWVSMLALPSCRVFLSYITSWLVICGWQAILSGSGYLGGNQVIALIALNNPNYVPELWHGTLLFWGFILVAVFINTVTSRVLPQIEVAVLVLHVVGFFAFMIPIVHLAPEKASSHDVFTQFSNGGGWSSQGLSFFVGLIGSVFAMFGCDSAVHMAEETRNAEVVVPWCMVSATLLNGAIGWGMVIAVLFVTVDITAALESPTGSLGFPIIDITYSALGSKAGTSVLTAILLFMTAAGAISAMATSSRLIWALARDRGLPGWRLVTKLQAKTAIPTLAIIITSLVAILVGLINIGSATAFNAVISLSVSSLYASYIITETLLLYRRCTGFIHPHQGHLSSLSNNNNNNNPANKLTWGPFHLPGIFGIAVNIFAVAFGLIIFFFSFWPVATPVEPATMNYSIVTAAVVIFAVVYYVVYARRIYTGPVVEVVFEEAAVDEMAPKEKIDLGMGV